MTKVQTTSVSYPRDLVLAAACTAQRINGEYVKRPFTPYMGYHRGFQQPYYPVAQKKTDSTKLPNRTMMKAILESDRSNILPEDYEKAELVRSYFCSMITLVFSGDAHEFMKTAIDVATCEEIPEEGKMFGVAASLPSVYEKNIVRQRERENLQSYTNNSVPLNESIGDIVKLNVTIVDSIFKDRYQSYAVNAVVNDGTNQRVVFFFNRHNWVKGNTYDIKGRIKAKHQQTTQLNYVSQLTQKELKDI